MELRDNFEVESFYRWMEEVNENFPIPVQCDEDYTLCAHCEDEKAMVRVSYERNNKSFVIDLCMECYSCPDFQELKSTYQNVKVKLI